MAGRCVYIARILKDNAGTFLKVPCLLAGSAFLGMYSRGNILLWPLPFNGLSLGTDTNSTVIIGWSSFDLCERKATELVASVDKFLFPLHK